MRSGLMPVYVHGTTAPIDNHVPEVLLSGDRNHANVRVYCSYGSVPCPPIQEGGLAALRNPTKAPGSGKVAQQRRREQMRAKHKNPIGPSAKPIPKVISFQDPLPEPQRYRPQANRILSGDPAQAATNLFQSADGRFKSGIWEAQPGKWRVVFTESEFCHLLAGVIVVTGDDGSKCTFRAGDAFVSPAGFLGTWEIIEPAKKLYANYE